MSDSKIPFVFFGTPHLAVVVLEQLKKKGYLPSLIVTAPDKPVGRGMRIQSPPVKQWAQEHAIPVLQPTEFSDDVIQQLSAVQAEVFIVVAYGKILPIKILDIPAHGTLNVHPSLLPKLRGPSPVRSAILQDERMVGVTIMQLDEKMDHGPILVQEAHEPEQWPPDAQKLDTYLFERGGELLADILPQYVRGEIELQEQDHDAATYCHLFSKEDGELNLADDPYTNVLKTHAYAGWPGTYFFANTVDTGKPMRVRVVKAHIEDGALVIGSVVPEGRSEMSYAELLKFATPKTATSS